MAGLFDFLSQNPAITQGLLAGAFGALAGRGTRAQAWGQGGLAALQGYGQGLNQQASEQERKLQAQRAAIQEQMLNMQLQQAQEAQKGKTATQNYLAQALSPVAPIGANAASGVAGPRPDDLQAVGKTPGFSLEGALKAGVPLEMIPTIQQTLQKTQPKLETIAPGAKVGYYGPDGKWHDVAENPKEEDLTKLIVRGPDGKPMINQLAFDVQRTLRRDGRSSVDVSYGPITAGVDANGNPVFFRLPRGAGAPEVVPDVKPPDATKPPTEFEAKAGLYFKSMQKASEVLNRLESSGRTDWMPSLQESVAPDKMKPLVMSTGRQSYTQAQKQWIDSINRVRSGANLPELEYERAVATFFPVFGEKDKTIIEQKRNARAQEEEAMKNAAGRAMPGNKPAGMPAESDIDAELRRRGLK